MNYFFLRGLLRRCFLLGRYSGCLRLRPFLGRLFDGTKAIRSTLSGIADCASASGNVVARMTCSYLDESHGASHREAEFPLVIVADNEKYEQVEVKEGGLFIPLLPRSIKDIHVEPRPIEFLSVGYHRFKVNLSLWKHFKLRHLG